MGALIDEESGKEPACIFCGSTGDCPHLVAVIDRTFADCKGGALYEAIDKFRKILADSVFHKIRARDGATSDHELASIVQEAIENYDPEYPDDVFIDGQMFLTWLIEALIDAGAEEHSGYVVEEGGPGQSSALSLLFAPDPERVIQNTEKALQDAVARL